MPDPKKNRRMISITHAEKEKTQPARRVAYRSDLARNEYEARRNSPAKQKEFDERVKKNTENRIRAAFYSNGDFDGGHEEAMRYKEKSENDRAFADYRKKRRSQLK